MSETPGNGKGSATGGCPVDHSAISKNNGDQKQRAETASEAPHGSGCPVDHSKRGPSFAQSLFGRKSSSGCPVDHKDEQINPLNMMPELPQEKHDGQKEELSTDRELSSIPRASGTTEDN
ncbi:hypothetical protein GGI23_004240, partial [Coemansia sp. RSA 2559]